jgi:hypothetical protein
VFEEVLKLQTDGYLQLTICIQFCQKLCLDLRRLYAVFRYVAYTQKESAGLEPIFRIHIYLFQTCNAFETNLQLSYYHSAVSCISILYV